MSRPSGGGGDLARSASSAALRGALLIGLAVIVGVFLLQRVDTSKSGSPTTTTTVRRATTTTTAHPAPTTTSTLPATPMKTPDQLRVLVLNGGAPTGAAATLRNELQQVGYTNQPQANTWSGHRQNGKTLMCKPGFDREKVALSQQTPLQGVSVVPFASPAPPFSSDVDCVVVVGA
jgi:hypothetical protein